MVATYSLYPQGLVMWIILVLLLFTLLKLVEMKRLMEDNLCYINGGFCIFAGHIFLASRITNSAWLAGEMYLRYCWNN